MCFNVEHLASFACRKNPEHMTRYKYLPKSGRRCVETYKDRQGNRHEEVVKARRSCRKGTKSREPRVDQGPVRLFPPGWCPQRGCGGKGMPGQIQKGRHEKINWKRVVEIDVAKRSSAAQVWEDAFSGTGEFRETADSEISESQAPSSATDMNGETSEAPSITVTDYSEATGSTAGFESEEDQGSMTPTGHRSLASLSESEADCVELSRRGKYDKQQRRLPRHDRAAGRTGQHPAQPSLAIRTKSWKGAIEWPDLGLIGEAIKEGYASDDAVGNRKGRANPDDGFDPRSAMSPAELTRQITDAQSLEVLYEPFRGRRWGDDMYARAQQHTGEIDTEVDSQAGSQADDISISLNDEDGEQLEERFNRFRDNTLQWESYWVVCQKMMAELFTVSFPGDWPDEPVEQHIQTPRLLDQMQSPSSELSRVLYGAAAEAWLQEECDSSEDPPEEGDGDETETETEVGDEIEQEIDEIPKKSKRLSTIREEDSELRSAVSATSTQKSVDRGGRFHSKQHGPSRAMKEWLEDLDQHRPEFDKAMRRQFAECGSDAERKELLYLLKHVAPDGVVLEHVTRAIMNPNFSAYAQPGTRGEKSLQVLTDPKGREARARAMRNSQLDRVNLEGTGPPRWDEDRDSHKRLDGFWSG